MATTTGTCRSTSRQGTGGAQTRTMTVETSPGPPPVIVTFDCSEEFFNDAKCYLGKNVTVTHGDPPAEGVPASVTGLRGNG